MSWITWIFLESFLALGALLITALFILLVYWRRTGRPRPLLVGCVAALILLVVQAAVTTPREHAKRTLDEIEIGIVEHSAQPLADALAPDFFADPFDRTAFIDYVKQKIELVDIRWIRRQNTRLESRAHDRFVVSMGYLADVRGEYGGTVPSRWRITFTKTDAGWKIANIECVKLAFLESPTWAEIDRQ